MENRRFLGVDRFMRAAHLYTGLLLVPWMTVYAISAFCLNRYAWFSEKLELGPKWQTVSEVGYSADPAASQDPEDLAAAVLRHVELEGPHRIIGTPDANQLTLFRFCGTGLYRITWRRPQSQVVVEQQRPFSFYSFVNAMHFQRGYDQPYAAWLTWAAIVDLVTFSTVLWVVSGIWIWARRPRKRLAGGLCLVAGCVLFAVLSVLLCR